MDQLQANLYKLLVELDDICKRNDVEYYLAGGTALGAIRGGGFLPWDDDIDLYITRKNWDKLVKVMETETPEDRNFVCVENEPIYRNPVGRYVDKNTTVMMKSQILAGKACGQLIEFFVMDPMPLDSAAKWEHRKKVKIYTELLSPYFVVNRNILYENTEFDFELYKQYLARSEKEGLDVVLKELLDEITSVDESESDMYCMRWGLRTLMYGQELLGKPRLERFEEAMFPVPAMQEKVARVAYGDSWMYVPDGAGKVVHDLTKDLNRPFQQYVDMYMPLIDKDKVYAAFEKNKRIRTEALPYKDEFRKDFATVRAKIAAETIRYSDYDLDMLDSLLEKRNFEELGKHLDYYYMTQMHPEVKTNGVFVDLPDEYLRIAILYYILQGSYYRASKAIEIRLHQRRPLGDGYRKALELFDFCRDISIAIYDEMDTDILKSVLEAHPEYEDAVPDYAFGVLWKLAKEEKYEELKTKAEAYLVKWGRMGEILRFKALATYHLDGKEASYDIYLEAINATRNGYVWKEAKELCGIDAYDIVDADLSVLEADEGEEDKDEKESKSLDGSEDE